MLEQSERVEVQWCTTCGARFTEEEVKGVSACPKCGSKGVPCATDQDILIAVNWHELRVLGIWASNLAANPQIDADSRHALRGILSRLERQAPQFPPLTLAGEIRQLRQVAGEVTTHGIAPEGFVVVHGPGAVGHAKPLDS